MRRYVALLTFFVIAHGWLALYPAAWTHAQAATEPALVASNVSSLEKLAPAQANTITTAWRPTAEAPPPKFQFKPYGSLWANMLATTQRTYSGPFTLWVYSAEDQPESAFEIDARRSRVGLDIVGPNLKVGSSDFDSTGRIEIDFFGQFLTENAAGARLRHAYWEASNPDWRLLIGQTWDVISPLRPSTVNFSVGWAAGNIGFRRAQFRVERNVEFANSDSLRFQASLNQDIIADFPAIAGVNRESANFPVIMTRVAYTYSLPRSDQPLVIGFSGHYGQTGFDFLQAGPPPLNLPPENDVRFPSWSANMDAEIPLHTGLVVRGEFFHGANLSPFLGGIGQGVCPCVRRSVHATGGWFEVARSWSPHWDTHVGSGIDDPANGDFTTGRGMNQFIFANQIWHVSDALSTGLELAWWRTLYQETRVGQIPAEQLLPTRPGEAYVLEWMVRYDF